MQIAGALVLTALALAPQAPAVDPPPQSPFSVDRIRKALERPASDRLVPRPITPDFVVDIRERQRFEKLAPPWDFKSGPVPPGGLYAYEQLQRSGVGIAQPLFMVDLLAIAHSVAHAVGDARAGAARDEVQRAIVEYCYAQRDHGAGLQLCSLPRVR